MKGTILFDSLNDITYYEADEELSNHIKKLAFKDGLLEASSFANAEEQVDKNIVMQLFSPLIASYKVMQAQFANKYKYIESEEGVLLVFDEILNHIAIHICNKDQPLEEVQKELALFLILIDMLFGPSLHMMKNDYNLCCKENSRKELVSLILKKWRVLKMEQQMYLVEAIERLIINQDITAMCISLLQEVLEKVRHTHKGGTFSHAFALVDTKLLALYSSRNSGQLSKETLLLLTLVIQVLKCSPIPLHEDNEKIADDEFFIPISIEKIKSNLPQGENKKKSSFKKNKKQIEELNSSMKEGSHSILVYLKSQTGSFVPHILYTVEVTTRITISILCELAEYGSISSLTVSLVHHLNHLYIPSPNLTQHVSFDLLDTNFRKLVDFIMKMKNTNDKEKHLKKLVNKWEQLKQNNLEASFHLPKPQNADSRLESSLSSCCELLTSFFEELIATPCLKYEETTHDSEHQEVFKHIQKVSVKRLNDVADFLEVKSVQNITMASEYPGLIHFIYVDRSSDCLIAPNVVLKKGHLSGTPSLKVKIWKMVIKGRKYIDGSKNFSCLWKEGDLSFFYHIWFEDSSGTKIKPTSYPSLRHFPKKGIICGNFYKKLIKECFPDAAHNHILCYEFFCIHLESIPAETVVSQSKKLCIQLWDFGGAYRTSLDLL